VLYEVLARYDAIIRAVAVERFRHFGSAHELRASITFSDESILHVRDYLFRDGSRKYAYHWQTRHGRMRRRWDNSAHWPEIATHPHHVHIGKRVNVKPSSVRDLAGALASIADVLRQPRQRRRSGRSHRRK
jgi:hypothetical protein